MEGSTIALYTVHCSGDPMEVMVINLSSFRHALLRVCSVWLLLIL